MWKITRATASVIAPIVVATCAVAGSAAADDQPTPTGSVIAVTTSLAGAGQDLGQTLVNDYKPFWDEAFDYPVVQDRAGNMIPGYAESWSASDDKLTWTFIIRDGVKFHNGDTMTAKDVAFSWNRLMFDKDSKHNLTGFAPDVDSITADGNKVIVKTKTPQSLLPLWFAKIEGNLGGSVLDEKYVESIGIAQASRMPVGTGPYKVVSINGEQSAQLTAFDDPTRSDWQKTRTPGFKDLTVLAVPEESTRLALLKTGGADLVPLGLSSAEEVKSTPGLRLITAPDANYSGMWCVGFTLNPASKCNDERVREALSIAIDRKTIADTLYNGFAQPSGAFYGGPGSFGYPDNMPTAPFDPDRAQKLLADAGFNSSNPLKVNIVTYNDDDDFPMMPTLAEAIVGYYQNIGVQATISVSEWDTQKALLVNGKLTGQGTNPVTPITLFLRGIDNRYYFPAEDIGAYTASGRIGQALWDNTKLPEQQKRLDEVAGTFDLTKQAQLYGDYKKWMADSYNIIPLLTSSAVFGVSAKVKDWQPIAGKPFINQLWTLSPVAAK